MEILAVGKLARLQELLSEASAITFLTHTHPDGDAVGSSLAAFHFIREFFPGKKLSLVYDSPAPAFLDFLLQGEEYVVAGTEPEKAAAAVAAADLLICTDISGLDRCGSLEQAARAGAASRILVDHHLAPAEEEFSLVFSTTGISSASELMFNLLKATPQLGGDAGKLPEKAKYALMTGMTTDTNNFANSVWPSTLSMASELLEAGVDRDFILDRLYRSCRENRLRACAYMLKDKLVVRPEGYAYMVMSEEEKLRFDIREGELEGLVNEPLAIEKVSLSLFLREDDGKFRVSIRSKRGTSANLLAKAFFHGGGHEQASGGKLFFPEDIARREDASEYIENAVSAFLNKGTITAKEGLK